MNSTLSPGPLSVTLHVPSKSPEFVVETIQTLTDFLSKHAVLAKYLDLHLEVSPYDRQFNFWRNIARLHARSDYVMLIDVDFYVCTDLSRKFQRMKQWQDMVQGKGRVVDGVRTGKKVVLVVPAFEHAPLPPPEEMDPLLALPAQPDAAPAVAENDGMVKATLPDVEQQNEAAAIEADAIVPEPAVDATLDPKKESKAANKRKKQNKKARRVPGKINVRPALQKRSLPNMAPLIASQHKSPFAHTAAPADPMPTSKAQLLPLLSTGEVLMFHGKWKRGHGPTNYEKWVGMDKVYKIEEYNFNYEPYVIMPRENAPW